MVGIGQGPMVRKPPPCRWRTGLPPIIRRPDAFEARPQKRILHVSQVGYGMQAGQFQYSAPKNEPKT